MKAIRKINNNVAVCQDAGGSELIAFGKGIGFPAMPYEIENLDVIDRTFYDLNPSQVALISKFRRMSSGCPSKSVTGAAGFSTVLSLTVFLWPWLII